MTSSSEVALLRIVAQRLAGPRRATPTDAVRWLTAVQGQELPGALTSVALRAEGAGRVDVEAALGAGEVVRSWPMRGTLHLVAARDLHWMLDLLGPRVLAGAASRREVVGLTLDDLERSRELAVAALRGGGRMSRAELLAALAEGGALVDGQRGYHTLWYLSQTGTLVLGPTRDGDQLFTLLDEWVPAARRETPADPMAELALRFFRSHGPATVKDLVRWAGVLVRDVRPALASVRDQLGAVDVDGTEHLMDPATPDLLTAHRDEARRVFLLPGFDELVLGYADRSCTVPPEFATRIVPGSNGIFKPTVVSDGQVVGTWRASGKGARRSIAVEPFTVLEPGVDTAVTAAFQALP
jgi:hypothetical protein